MATILKGAPVVAAMNERNALLCEQLKAKGITPTLAVVRVGEREDDLSYERGVTTRCGKVGVAVRQFVLPADATQEQLLRVLDEVNTDDGIHGCLLFRPLPKQFDDRTIRAALRPEKDIDGITDGSLAGVFTNTDLGYAPCTAQACMEILKYYNVPLSGKRAVVVGRSLVVGKPAAMMLDRENATVTLCNSRTRNLPEVCRQADIVVVAMGKMGAVGADCLREGQTVVDVGIHVNEEGKLCGDVRFGEAEPLVEAITPVPGGVGTVTTSVLVSHVVEAAEKTGADLVISPYTMVIPAGASKPEQVLEKVQDDLGVMHVARPPETREYGFLPAGIYDKDTFALRLMDKPASYFYGVLWNKLYRRDLLAAHDIRFTSEMRWAEDLVFNMQYIQYAEVFASIPQPGYYYVQNPQSICHTQIKPATLVQNKIQVFRYYKDLYTRLGMYEEVRPQLYKFLIDIAESTYPSGPFKKVIDEAKAYWKEHKAELEQRS